MCLRSSRSCTDSMSLAGNGATSNIKLTIAFKVCNHLGHVRLDQSAVGTNQRKCEMGSYSIRCGGVLDAPCTCLYCLSKARPLACVDVLGAVHTDGHRSASIHNVHAQTTARDGDARKDINPLPVLNLKRTPHGDNATSIYLEVENLGDTISLSAQLRIVGRSPSKPYKTYAFCGRWKSLSDRNTYQRCGARFAESETIRFSR
jgi:hypothetical protein